MYRFIIYIYATVYPGSQPPCKKCWFLLDDDKPKHLKKSGETRKLTYSTNGRKWWPRTSRVYVSHSIYGTGSVFPYIYHKHQRNVGKHTTRGWYGYLPRRGPPPNRVLLTFCRSVLVTNTVRHEDVRIHGWGVYIQ